MMKRFYCFLLDCNSISLFFVVYFIKEHKAIVFMKVNIAYIIYVVVILLFTVLCLFLSQFLPDETIQGGIKEVELADGSYLASYLGYFFVALSVSDKITLLAMGIIIFLFTYYSQTLYFNPLFLLFRYRFYYMTMENGMKLFVLTKKSIKNVDGLTFNNLKRINDYTFIDRSRGK